MLWFPIVANRHSFLGSMPFVSGSFCSFHHLFSSHQHFITSPFEIKKYPWVHEIGSNHVARIFSQLYQIIAQNCRRLNGIYLNCVVILIDHLKHEILMYIINNVDDSLDPRPLLGWVWQVLVNFGLSFVKYDVACFRPSSTSPPKRVAPSLLV